MILCTEFLNLDIIKLNDCIFNKKESVNFDKRD